MLSRYLPLPRYIHSFPHVSRMATLLDHGANPLLRDSEGASALFMCCQNGHYDIIKLLYRYGARDELLYMHDGMV
jgi:ankyrin repeat protein